MFQQVRQSCFFSVEFRRKKTFFCTLFLTNSMEVFLYNNYEKGDEMYYELYVDSLFLVNFVMNLYLLLLVNQSTNRTATRFRLMLGAAVGAFCYLLPFFIGGPILLRYLSGAFAGMAAMIFTAFHIGNRKAFFLICRKLLVYSFLMGGCILFFIRTVPICRRFLTGIFGVMGIGAVIFLFLFYGKRSEEKSGESSLCKVTLVSNKKAVTVTALLDSGNSLIEPISKKPVCVVESSVLADLWDMPDMIDAKAPFNNHNFRVIPYHSIGRKQGILYGYLLEELQIEINGMVKVCHNVYAASSEEIEGRDAGGEEGVKMILNPDLLKEEYVHALS